MRKTGRTAEQRQRQEHWPAPPIGDTEIADRELGCLVKYMLGDECGQGGTSKVIAGTEVATGRPVAVKVLDRAPGEDAFFATNFENEIRILRALAHPHVMPVLDAGLTDAGQAYLVMPLMQGGDLWHVLEAIKAGHERILAFWTRRRQRRAFLQLASAVRHAHRHGIIHRDLKPSNVLFDRHGHVRLSDWGLAGPPGSLTFAPEGSHRGLVGDSSHAVGGTAGYMSPEHVGGVGRDIGIRSDIWSLGAILYELLTLHPVVNGQTEDEKMVSTRRGALLDLRVHARLGEIPKALAQVVIRALAHDATDRYATVDDFAAALRQAPWPDQMPGRLGLGNPATDKHTWRSPAAGEGL